MECDPHESFTRQSDRISEIKERLAKKLVLLNILWEGTFDQKYELIIIIHEF